MSEFRNQNQLMVSVDQEINGTALQRACVKDYDDPVASESRKIKEGRTLGSLAAKAGPHCLCSDVIRLDAISKQHFDDEQANHVRLCPRCKSLHDLARAFLNVYDPSQ